MSRLPASPATWRSSARRLPRSSAAPSGAVLLDHLGHRLDHVGDVLVGVRRAQWKREHPLELPVRDREILGTQLVTVAVVRQLMHWYEMHARPDVARAQLLDELIAADSQAVQTKAEQIDVPRALDLWPL